MARTPTKKPIAGPVARPVLKDRAVAAKAAEYAAAKAEIAVLEARCNALKPELLAAMGEHLSVVAGNHILTRAEFAAVAPTPNRTITREMIGQVIPGQKGRKGYSTLTVQ